MILVENAQQPVKSSGQDRCGSDRRVRVWDGPTRLFHWLIVLLVIAAYVTWHFNLMDWHEKVGYATLALVIFRLLWGFLGSETARFSHFIASPAGAARYLTHLSRAEPDRQAGHNPAGGWMVLLLIVLLLGETLSGVFVNNDVADEGPLTELTPVALANAITDLHLVLWDVFLVGVALHLLAIFIYATAFGHNLLLPMIAGWKILPGDVPQPRAAGLMRAAALFGCSVIATAFIAYFL